VKIIPRDIEIRVGKDEHNNEGSIYAAIHDCYEGNDFDKVLTHRKIVLTLDCDLHLNSMQDIYDLYDVLVIAFKESNNGLPRKV
jgi:hypothetical protein